MARQEDRREQLRVKHLEDEAEPGGGHSEERAAWPLGAVGLHYKGRKRYVCACVRMCVRASSLGGAERWIDCDRKSRQHRRQRGEHMSRGRE